MVRRKAKFIAVVNQKGGSCKTTTARMLQRHLSAKGYKVLAVDADPQGSLTEWIGLDPHRDTKQMSCEASRIYTDDGVSGPYHRFDNCDFLPACSKELAEKNKRNDFTVLFKLKEFLHSIEDQYDYIILDTPGSLDNITQSAVMACPTLVIPMITAPNDRSSTKGFFRGISDINTITNTKTHEVFIVPSIYNKQTSIDNEILEDIHINIAPFLSRLPGLNGAKVYVTKPIPDNVSIKEAASLCGETGIGGISPQEALASKYKKQILETINEICEQISGGGE